jgi:hypothetical protein
LQPEQRWRWWRSDKSITTPSLVFSIGIVISNLPLPPEYFFRNSVQSHINPDALAAKTM